MTQRTDRLLLVNAMLGQFISGFAARMFAVSLPTIAGSLHADILAIAWAIIAYQLAGIESVRLVPAASGTSTAGRPSMAAASSS